MTSLDQVAFNGLFRLRGAIGWDPRLVVVTVDDVTLAQLGRFPIDRAYYTQLIDQLTQVQASVVGVNILFPEGSPEDPRLAAAMERYGRVVLGEIWDEQGTSIQPNPTLAEAAIGIGHLRYTIDSDGITRKVELVGAFGAEVAQVYNLVAEPVNLPQMGEMWINWPGNVSTLTQYPLSQVLAGQVALQAFQDKIVLVGVTATGLGSLSTPYNFQPPVGGVYFQAAVINTLLQENWLHPLRPGIYVLILGTLGVLLGYCLRDQTFLVQFCIGIGSVIGWLGISFALLWLNIWLPVIAPVFLSLGLITILIGLGRLQMNALLQARSEFLSTMSHEIRTPMNAIIGTAELLRETPMTADQQDLTETIYLSSQTLLTLINDILDFSKLESGKFELEQRPIQMATCIERSLELVAQQANEKNLELAYLVEPVMPPVFLGDEIRLRQILINLLSNAVKFTATGAVTVRARMQRLPSQVQQRRHHTLVLKDIQKDVRESHPQLAQALNHASTLYTLRIDVQDSGIGIAPEQVEKLFQPYVQANRATSRHYGGTGLGLAICRKLVSAMGGKIWADSLLNQGTTFSFAIPVIADETAPRLPLSQPEKRLVDRHLGVIEPNVTRQLFIAQQATLWGMRVQILPPTASGWAVLPDISRLSAVLVNVDAIAEIDQLWLNQLRQAAQSPDLPLLLMVCEQLPSSLLTLKHVTVLHKSLKRQLLFDALLHAFAHQVPGQPPADGPTLPPPENQPDFLDLPLKILLAEDNLVNQKVALRMLQRLGLAADVVSSGKEALLALDNQRYDVILMDMRMPEMDGIEATEAIRHRGEDINDPWIVAMTANATKTDRHRCLAAGMNDYLSKPIQLGRLGEALKRAAEIVNPPQSCP